MDILTYPIIQTKLPLIEYLPAYFLGVVSGMVLFALFMNKILKEFNVNNLIKEDKLKRQKQDEIGLSKISWVRKIYQILNMDFDDANEHNIDLFNLSKKDLANLFEAIKFMKEDERKKQ